MKNIEFRNNKLNINDFMHPEEEKDFEMFPLFTDTKNWSKNGGSFVTASVET